MTVRAGETNRLVSIQTPADAIDTSGGVTQVYTEQTTRWASIVSGTGSERTEGDKVASDVTHTVTMRWDSVAAGFLTGAARIVDGTLTLEVDGVVNKDQADIELIAFCRETA